MKKILYLFGILFIMMLLTGCSAKADITVNVDGSVNENINVSDNNKNIKYGDKTIRETLNLYLNQYDTQLSVGKYETDINIGNENSSVDVYRKYDDICDFINKTLFSNYIYEGMTCNEDEYYFEVQSNGNFIKKRESDEPWLMPDDIKLTITLPVAATEQNADETDGNTYIWNYDQASSSDKSFHLKVSKVELKEAEENYNEAQAKKERNKKIVIAFTIVGIAFVVGIISFILYLKYKSKKIDYS